MSKIIEFDSVSFRYTREHENVVEVEKLSFSKGEKVFIHGPSGCGKSTLLNLISGVLRPSSGEITILGQKLSSLSTSKLDSFRGEHMGYVFQGLNLIDYLTIRENIILPSKISKPQPGLEQRVQSISQRLGIGDLLDRRVVDLSVGQQQRVAVARALASGPKIMIADEPTSALDDDISDEFMKLLIEEQKANDFALLFVSHDKRLARFFDRTISMQEINKVRVRHA